MDRYARTKDERRGEDLRAIMILLFMHIDIGEEIFNVIQMIHLYMGSLGHRECTMTSPFRTSISD